MEFMSGGRFETFLPAPQRSMNRLLFRIPGLRFIASAVSRNSMIRNSAHFARHLVRSCTSPYWVVAFGLRKKSSHRRQAAMVRQYLSAPGAKKLHIGCGKILLDGWLNTDIRQDIAGVCYLDASEPFPLEDRSIDYVFNEHIIEHLPYQAGAAMLRESFRVLRPGGRIRIATPDLKKILALYTGQPTADQEPYIHC